MIRNQSGYADPTVDSAVGRITAQKRRAARRPLVYIASPYSGDIQENIRKAQKYCAFAIAKRMTPIATHLMYPQVLGERETRETRELAMTMGREIIRQCRELWWFEDAPSPGMKAEIDYANRKELIIRHFTEDCREVSMR